MPLAEVSDVTSREELNACGAKTQAVVDEPISEADTVQNMSVVVIEAKSDEATDKSAWLDFLAGVEAKPQERELPEPSSVFKDEIGSTVFRYSLPDIDIESWLGLWYDRQIDADTKSGIKVSNVRLSSFSMHSKLVDTPKPWKATTTGGFATFVVQESSSKKKYQVYVAACELMRGGYNFEVDITANNGLTATDAMTAKVVSVAKERPSTAMRQRLLGGGNTRPVRPHIEAKVAPSATVAETIAEVAPHAGGEATATSESAKEVDAKRKGFTAKLSEDRCRREEESGAKRIERQRMLEVDAKKKAEERKQRVSERTPMRAGRCTTPMPVISDWRRNGSQRAPASALAQ